jgi:hypothetical protein
MMDLALTLHAQKRMQQRGIPPFVIELLGPVSRRR